MESKEESELPYLLFFTDSNLLIHFSLLEAPRRKVVGDGVFEHVLGPQVYTGGAVMNVTL